MPPKNSDNDSLPQEKTGVNTQPDPQAQLLPNNTQQNNIPPTPLNKPFPGFKIAIVVGVSIAVIGLASAGLFLYKKTTTKITNNGNNVAQNETEVQTQVVSDSDLRSAFYQATTNTEKRNLFELLIRSKSLGYVRFSAKGESTGLSGKSFSEYQKWFHDNRRKTETLEAVSIITPPDIWTYNKLKKTSEVNKFASDASYYSGEASGFVEAMFNNMYNSEVKLLSVEDNKATKIYSYSFESTDDRSEKTNTEIKILDNGFITFYHTKSNSMEVKSHVINYSFEPFPDSIFDIPK